MKIVVQVTEFPDKSARMFRLQIMVNGYISGTLAMTAEEADVFCATLVAGQDMYVDYEVRVEVRGRSSIRAYMEGSNANQISGSAV